MAGPGALSANALARLIQSFCAQSGGALVLPVATRDELVGAWVFCTEPWPNTAGPGGIGGQAITASGSCAGCLLSAPVAVARSVCANCDGAIRVVHRHRFLRPVHPAGKLRNAHYRRGDTMTMTAAPPARPSRPAAPRRAGTWFDVDKEGLAALLDARGREFAIFELVSNAWDEDGVTTVRVSLTQEPTRRARWLLRVEDDAPDGFADLSHAWRLFASSAKKNKATKRGRFNLGEKLVLAICDWATVTSTTAAVRFHEDGTRTPISERTERGSVFEALVRMTKPQAEAALAKVLTLIPPQGITTYINGEALAHRTPVRVLDVKAFPTVLEVEGQFRPTERNTTIALYEPAEGEKPMLYELGIPVVEHSGRWHSDVGQKVPLNQDRDNVTPAFLRRLRTEVLNATSDIVTADDTTRTWVNDALASPRITPDTVRQVILTRFGPDAVVYDPSDREANKIAASQGRPVIHGRTFTGEAWANIRAADVLLPAGKVTPSAKVLSGPDGEPPIPVEKWTPGMRRMAAYAQAMSEHLLGFRVSVAFSTMARMSTGGCAAAYYGGRTLTFVMQSLGHRFFNAPDQVKTDELIIHEFGHQFSGDHLSSDFHDALCLLGAKLRTFELTLEDFDGDGAPGAARRGASGTAPEVEVFVPLGLLEAFVQPGDEPCSFDHHGGCQEHGHLSLLPGERCPQVRLREIVRAARAGATSEGGQQ